MRGTAYLAAAAAAVTCLSGSVVLAGAQAPEVRPAKYDTVGSPDAGHQKVLGGQSSSGGAPNLAGLDPATWLEPQSAGGCAACETLLLTLKLAAYRGDAAFIKTLTGICLRGAVQDPDVCEGSIALEGPIAAQALRSMRIGSATSRYFCATTVGLCDYPPPPSKKGDDAGITLPPPPPRSPDEGERDGGHSASLGKKEKEKKKPLKVVHFSDIHVDPFYTEGTNANCTKPICCRDFSATDPPSDYDVPAGPNGDHKCDSPLSLEDSMYAAMERLVPDAAFSIFTGDIVDHAVWNTTREQNTLDIRRAYRRMGQVGGGDGGIVYATAGNHESSPTNSYKPGSVEEGEEGNTQWLYDLLSSRWSRWIGGEAGSQSRAFGAYSTRHSGPGRLRVISLNTNLFYAQNYWLYSEPMAADPDGQLAWLARELEGAERAGERVYIIGHMPPGSRDAVHASSSLLDRIVARYAERGTVAGLFFGHTHVDEFELSYATRDGDENQDRDQEKTHETAAATWYIAASLTPTSGHPSFRVYDVDPDTFAVLDFTTYAADMSDPSFQAASPGPRWRKVYSAREVYEPLAAAGDAGEEDEAEQRRLQPLSPAFWHNVTVALERNATALDEYLLRKRRGWSRESEAPPPCRDDCARREICKLRAARAQDNCVEPAFRLGIMDGDEGSGRGSPGRKPGHDHGDDECERSVLRDVLVQTMRPGRGDLRALLGAEVSAGEGGGP